MGVGQDFMTLTIAIGTILNLQFQVGAHPRAMDAIGSEPIVDSDGIKDLGFTIHTCLTLLLL